MKFEIYILETRTPQEVKDSCELQAASAIKILNEENARLRAALREVVKYNNGECEYDYSKLTFHDRNNQAFDDWLKIREKIDALLGEVSEANGRGVPVARKALSSNEDTEEGSKG